VLGSDKLELQRIPIPRTNLRIDVPRNWTKGTECSGESVLVFLKAGKGLYPNVNITAVDQDGKSVEELTDKWLGILASSQVHYRKKETIGGMECVVCDTSWKSLLGGLRAVRLTTVYRGKALVIIFVDRSGEMTDPMRKTYLECLRTLTIDDR